MRPAAKRTSARALPRKAAARLAVRPTAPAWIDAEQGLAFTASVTRRVRDGLPLRAMPAKKTTRSPKGPHARGHR